VVAAIGVWGADKNILGPRRDELALAAQAAARDVSRALGYLDPEAAKPKPAAKVPELVG
jgi:hypothetical protein